jgi:hypothetical protein
LHRRLFTARPPPDQNGLVSGSSMSHITERFCLSAGCGRRLAVQPRSQNVEIIPRGSAFHRPQPAGCRRRAALAEALKVRGETHCAAQIIHCAARVSPTCGCYSRLCDAQRTRFATLRRKIVATFGPRLSSSNAYPSAPARRILASHLMFSICWHGPFSDGLQQCERQRASHRVRPIRCPVADARR